MARHHDRLRLRPVEDEDCERLWQWANDPETRQVSFSSEPIPWQDHVHWFQAKLREPGCNMLIAEDQQRECVGHIRSERSRDLAAVVSVVVAPEHRGKGHGVELIRLGTHRLLSETGATTVHAFIKPDNVASLRAFGKAGYRRQGRASIEGQPAELYVFEEVTPAHEAEARD